MRLVVIFLVALALAVGLGQGLSHDPGLVTIAYGGKLLRMSLGVALVLAVLISAGVTLVLRTAWRAITVRRRWREWRKVRDRRRSHEGLSDGVLALAAGEFARAERLLARASGTHATAAHYLAAAQAADAQQAPGRRDAYLALAREVAPKHTLPIALQQMEMQLAAGEFSGVREALSALEAQHSAHPRVLVLRHRYLAATDAWDEVSALLPRLKRAAAYPPARLVELEAECAARLLARPYPTREELTKVWHALPKPVRVVPVVILAYARVLLQFNAQASGRANTQGNAQAMAETVLRKALFAQWEPRLLVPYGDLQPPAAQDALRQAERWLPEHPQDPALLLALGRLCLTQALWGKAREYLEATLVRAPSALVFRLLAETLERLNDPAAAARQRQLGLEYATASKGPASLSAVVGPEIRPELNDANPLGWQKMTLTP